MGSSMVHSVAAWGPDGRERVFWVWVAGDVWRGR